MGTIRVIAGVKGDLARCAALLLFPVLLLAAGGRAVGETSGEPDLTSLPIEDLLELDVYSASRFQQRISDAPAAVRIITAAEIRDFGWRTLSEALSSLPGMYSSYDRSYAYLGTRGVLRPGDYITRFLLLVNGSRVNDSTYDQAAMGSDFLIDLDLVERIEYVPGPGSSGYGSNAFFGVINIITRRGVDYQRAEGRAEVGSNGHLGLAARFGRQYERGEVLLAASAQHTEGRDLYFPEFDHPDTNNGVADDLDGEQLRRFLATASFDDLELTLAHSVRSKRDPTASFAQLFNDPRSSNRDERSLLDLRYALRPRESLEITAHGFAGSYDYDGVFAYDPRPGPTNLDGSRATWVGFGVQALSTAWRNHKLLTGIDVQYDSRRDLFNYDDDPRVDFLDERTTNHRAGVFLQDEIRLTDTFLVNAGGRFDHDGVTGSHFSPRLALVYDSQRGTNLKLIVGTAFRSPNLYETTYTRNYGPTDARVSEEKITTRELVWTQQLAERTSLTASLFDYSLYDLIEATLNEQEESVFFLNRGDARTRGAELALDHVWEQGALLRASYGYARASAVGSAAVLENSPRQLAKLNFSAPITGTRLRAAIEARYVGKRAGLLATVDAYTLVNTSLTWTSTDARFDVVGSIHNLFDERYADPAGSSFAQNAIEQDGRTGFLRLVRRF